MSPRVFDDAGRDRGSGHRQLEGAPVNDDLLAHRIARLRAELGRSDEPTSVAAALDEVGRTLDRLRRTWADDDELALRLGGPRSTAASYIRATKHLAEAGADADLCEDVLRRGRARVIVELDEVHRALAAVAQAPGRR